MKLRAILESVMNVTDRDRFYKIIDFIKSKYSSKDFWFHGSKNIRYLKSISDINPATNSQTIKSKYFYVSNDIKTSINYASTNYDFPVNSGIAIFKIRNSKQYKFTNKDAVKLHSEDDYNKFLDMLKNKGYQSVLDKSSWTEIAILDNSILELIDIIYLNELILK